MGKSVPYWLKNPPWLFQQSFYTHNPTLIHPLPALGNRLPHNGEGYERSI
jgi:hypothetical protein